MIDVTKPRNYEYIKERGEEGLWCRVENTPLELFAWGEGYHMKYIHEFHYDDDTEFCYGDENLYTDYPAVAVKIEDYLYYISVSENPEILAEYPPEYKKQVDSMLAFVKQFHEIFSLHWYGKLDDSDLFPAIRLKTYFVCKSQEEYDRWHTEHNRICRKLRKLKKFRKYHGDI